MTQPSDMRRNRRTIDPASMRERVEDFVSGPPENTLGFDHPEKVFNIPLVGFAAGTDRLWQVYRDHIGAFYLTPADIFRASFPAASPAELRGAAEIRDRAREIIESRCHG